MPTTVPYGIVFPCENPELVDAADFQAYAQSVENAILSVEALEPPLLLREFVKAGGILPNTATGVSATISWTTPTATNNPNGMFNAGSPTLFTLQSSGSFLVWLHITNLTFPTTETSIRGAVLLGGVEQIWGKLGGPTSSNPQFNISGMLVSAAAGQQVTVNWVWTGTGGPITPLFDIVICKISDL